MVCDKFPGSPLKFWLMLTIPLAVLVASQLQIAAQTVRAISGTVVTASNEAVRGVKLHLRTSVGDKEPASDSEQARIYVDSAPISSATPH